MTQLVEILQSVGVFLGGLAARGGFFLAMLAVLVAPAVLGALALRALSARRERRLGLREVAGLAYRPGAWYAPGHTWLARRGKETVTLGADDLALRLLPAVTSLELPPAGSELRRGEPVAVLRGGGRSIQLRAPVDGRVVGVNAAALRDPGLVKREGYGRGWLVAFAPSVEALAALPRDAAAEGWLAREAERWTRLVEGRLGIAAADGGSLVSPAPWLVGERGWREFADAFLART
jgi:glycine cleavage system H lipoate-binding protein